MKRMKETLFQNNYFYMDATIFERELSANALLVYAYLCRCADKTGRSWPSHRTIAGACSLSITTVKLALTEMETQEIVSILPRYREQGGKSSNLYRISKMFQRVCAAGADIFKADVTSKAKLVYIHLCKCADKTGQSWPAHKTIARWCAIGVSTVRDALRQLADAAIVKIQERRRGDNGQTSNLYKVLQIAKSAVLRAFQNSRGEDSKRTYDLQQYTPAVAQSDDLDDAGRRAAFRFFGDSQIIAGSPGGF